MSSHPHRLRALLAALVGLSLVATAAAQSRLAESLARADSAFSSADWPAYAAVYAQLSAQSPDNGEYWYRLARARQELGQVDAAVDAYQHAVDRGYSVARSELRLASLAATGGKPESAVRHFERARSAHLVNAEQALQQDPALAKLLEDPTWRARLWPRVDGAGDRIGRWTADLRFLDKRMRETHWQLFSQVDCQKWEATRDRLVADLPRLADWQVSMRAMEWVRMGRAGHTLLMPPFQGDDRFHAAAIRLRWFADGLYVAAAPAENRKLVGQRVMALGTGSPDAVLKRAAKIIPHDSDSGLRALAGHYLSMPEVLAFYGFSDSREQLPLTLRDVRGREHHVVLPAAPIDMATLQGWMQFHDAPPDWITAHDGHPLPLWLQQPDRTFFAAAELQAGLIYAQLNAVRDGEDSSLAEFASQLRQRLADPATQGLILDLRHNRGGNGELLEPLLQTLIASPKLHQRGAFYVLISGQTFSAAALLIGDLERQLDPVFVGESSAAGPTHVGEDNMILLPNQGLVVLAASRMFVRSFSDDQRTAVAPDIAAPLRFSDYRDGLDPGLAAIVADHAAH
jgi:tetratricopeptide (TPR) repeat protein